MAEGIFGTSFNPADMIGISMDTILIIVIALVGVGIIFLMYQFFAFNKTVIVRKVANDRKIILYDKAKLVKGKDGVLKYKFQKLKIFAPLPPTEAIELTKKGKEFLECYLLETGEVTWITDANEKIGVLEPFTTNQRQMLEHEFYKAHLEKGKSWTEQLGMIVYVGALVILVIALMVFYGDMGKPLLEMGGTLKGFQENQNKMIEKQIEMQEKMNEMLISLNDLEKQKTGETKTLPNRVVPN